MPWEYWDPVTFEVTPDGQINSGTINAYDQKGNTAW